MKKIIQIHQQLGYGIIIMIICLLSFSVYPQFVSKKGGICFRIDDNHLVNQYIDYSGVFNKYGYNFCNALNIGLIKPTDTAFLNEVRVMISQGHEFMDHTPNHDVRYFTVNNYEDTLYYSKKPGVDHINKKAICLKYNSVKTNTTINEGLINIYRNMVISNAAGEFRNLTGNPYISHIYIASLNKAFSYNNLQNINPNDPDTLYIQSFWKETINLGTMLNVSYDKLTAYDIKMDADGINLLIEKTLLLCNELNIERPYVWLQPGGAMPLFNKEEIKQSAGELYHYEAGAASAQSALKCFNEYNPSLNRYGMMWGDFLEDSYSFASLKTIIANGIAKHSVLYGRSYFKNLSGGWQGYLCRMDSLLNWCFQNNIPVKTQREWASILYDSIPNPYENIFPPLNVDLDSNNIPDGYDAPYGILHKPKKVNKKYYLSENNSGYLCTIKNLGGIEKGYNAFSFKSKGKKHNAIRIRIILKQKKDKLINEDTLIYTIPVNNKKWNANQIKVFIPDSISMADITITSYKRDNSLKISNMKWVKWGKQSHTKSIPDTDNTKDSSELFTSESVSSDDPAIYQSNGLEFYPNPNNGNITLEYNYPMSENLKIMVQNAFGKIVFSDSFSYPSGKTKKSYNLSYLSSGIYYLITESKNNIIVKKIVIQE